MSATIGDGMTVLALAAGIVGYFYVKQQSLHKKNEIIHQERMAAMEKGIPLPEFPFEQEKERREPEQDVIAILGIFLLSLSLGTMIVLYLSLPGPSHSFWISPLPFAFLGCGLIVFRFLQLKAGR
jgi:hypothetical protein